MKVTFEDKQFKAPTLALIQLCNEIIEEYMAADFVLTLRQLYYQLVARDHIANDQKQYSRLKSVITKARMAGLVDWSAIEDRTRYVRKNTHWANPQSIVRAAINSYQINKWARQPFQPEVWIEKDALVGGDRGGLQ